MISAVITLIGGIIAVLTYVVRLSMDYAKLKTRVEQNEARDIEERTSNASKFQELYNSRNQTNETLKELTTTLKFLTQNIDTQFKNLELKVDSLRGGN